MNRFHSRGTMSRKLYLYLYIAAASKDKEENQFQIINSKFHFDEGIGQQMTVSSSSLNAADDRIGDRTFCCCCVKWNSLPWRRVFYFLGFRHVLYVLAACLLYENTAAKFRILYLLFMFQRKRKGHHQHRSSTRASWWAIRLLLLSMDFHSLTQSNDLQCITYSLSPSNSILAGLAWPDSLLAATHTQFPYYDMDLPTYVTAICYI